MSRPPDLRRWHPLALVPLALSAWVYHRLLHVFFFADDYYHLAQIADGAGARFVFLPFAGHNLVLRNLVFIATWKIFGVHPEGYYATVLATHLLNVWLLFRMLGSLTGSVALACFGAALWGTCPLDAGTLAWYSVYGQVLVATALLLALDGVTRVRASTGAVWGWCALLLAGSTCFGTGVAVALVFPIVLLLLVPAAWSRRGVRAACFALPVATVVVYVACRRIGTWLEPGHVGDAFLDLAAMEGVSYVPRMLGALLQVGIAGGALGYFADVPTLPAPRLWAATAEVALGLVLVAWRGDGRARRAAIALGALAVAIYALIAIGRASAYVIFKMSVVDAAKAPRYHYLGTLPIVVLLCLILQQLSRMRWLSRVPSLLALAAGLGLLVAGYVRSGFSIDEHPATRAYFMRLAEELKQAARAAPPGATVRLDNAAPPIGPMLQVFFPGRAAVFLLIAPSDEIEGRRMRFVERNRQVLDYWRDRPPGRMVTLLEAPE